MGTQMRSGASLLVVENFCTSIWNGVDDRVSKIEMSVVTKQPKDLKDFHVVDEHTEIDFGETVVSFFRTLTRYQIQWGSI